MRYAEPNHGNRCAGGQQQAEGQAAGSGAEAELTEWQKARIAEYQDAQTAQSGVSGQAAQGMISGLASEMNEGTSDQFTVSATGLDTNYSYEYVFQVRSRTSDGALSRNGIGFDARCNSVVTSALVPRQRPNYSAPLTLYACSAGSYQVSSLLRLINYDEDPDDPERVTTLDTDVATVTVKCVGESCDPPSPPPAPSNFRVTSTAQTSVVLAWSAQSQISGFHISGATRAIYPSKSSMSFTVSNLQCGTRYTFRIRAEGDNTNTQGWSPWSSDVSATTSVCPLPSITISPYRSSITEGQNAKFTLRASNAPSSNLTVNVSVGQKGSFISGSTPTSVQIPKDGISASFTVATSNDSVVETNGSITATVINGTGYAVGSPSAASVNVNSEDKPTITISRSRSSITEGQSVTFTLTASQAPLSNLAVKVSVRQSGSFISGSTPTSVQIPKDGTSASFTVDTSDDSVDERNGSITAKVIRRAGYDIGSTSSANVIVNDNDKPTITIAAGTSPITEGTSATFTLTASIAPYANLSVEVSVTEAQPGGPFISGMAPSSVTIAANGTTATLTVATDDDATDESNGSITAEIDAVAANAAYEVGSPSTARVNVQDNDIPKLAAPTGLTITPLPGGTERKARLSWGIVNGRKEYQVEVRQRALGSWNTWRAAPNGTVTNTSYEIRLDSIMYASITSKDDGPGLADASAYWFRVKAVGDGVAYESSEFSGNVELRDTYITSVNGDSSGRTDGKGQAVVAWRTVPGAVAYRLRWRKMADYQAVGHSDIRWRPQTAKDNDWTQVALSVNRAKNEHTVENLELGAVYAFQLNYDHLYVSSGRSTTEKGFAAREAYAWPAKGFPAENERVATYPFFGHWEDGEYNYTICKNSFPSSDKDEWEELVQEAAGSWSGAVSNLVTITSSTSTNCSVNPIGIFTSIHNDTNEVIMMGTSWLNYAGFAGYAAILTSVNVFALLHSPLSVSIYGLFTNTTSVTRLLPICALFANACVVSPAYDNDPRASKVLNDAQGSVDMLINYRKLYEPNKPDKPTSIMFNKCSVLGNEGVTNYELVVHETGHALGLSGFDLLSLRSSFGRYNMAHPVIPGAVMNYDGTAYDGTVELTEHNCSPHPLDIMAIYALYQTEVRP